MYSNKRNNYFKVFEKFIKFLEEVYADSEFDYIFR